MDGDEPGGDKVDKVMQDVGVRDAVDGGVQGEEEEEGVGDEAEAVFLINNR